MCLQLAETILTSNFKCFHIATVLRVVEEKSGISVTALDKSIGMLETIQCQETLFLNIVDTAPSKSPNQPSTPTFSLQIHHTNLLSQVSHQIHLNILINLLSRLPSNSPQHSPINLLPQHSLIISFTATIFNLKILPWTQPSMLKHPPPPSPNHTHTHTPQRISHIYAMAMLKY